MAKRVSKNIDKTTTEIKTLSKTRTWADFLNNDTYLMFPDKEDWRKRFCYTLVTWAEDENSLDLVQFVVDMKIARSTLYKWADDYPDIKKALDYARLILGYRKRNGALTRKFDKEVVFKDMHKLDPEWLEINKYHADLKKSEGELPTSFVVHLQKPEVINKEDIENEISEIHAKPDPSKV